MPRLQKQSWTICTRIAPKWGTGEHKPHHKPSTSTDLRPWQVSRSSMRLILVLTIMLLSSTALHSACLGHAEGCMFVQNFQLKRVLPYSCSSIQASPKHWLLSVLLQKLWDFWADFVTWPPCSTWRPKQFSQKVN